LTFFIVSCKVILVMLFDIQNNKINKEEMMEKTLLVHLFKKVGNDLKLLCGKYVGLYFLDDNELKKTIELLNDEKTLEMVLYIERLPGPEEPLSNVYFNIKKIIDSFDEASWESEFSIDSVSKFRVMEII